MRHRANTMVEPRVVRHEHPAPNSYSEDCPDVLYQVSYPERTDPVDRLELELESGYLVRQKRSFDPAE